MSPQNTFQINLPKALLPGDTLGIVAPAGPVDRVRVDAGLKTLQGMGFKLVVPDAIYAADGYLAGSDKFRAEQVHRMFGDPTIDGIICARGGYGAMRILPLLDVDLIKSHPKAFVGFSDITALLIFLSQRCGMAAFHGPVVTTLGSGDPITRDHFLRALTDTAPVTVVADKSLAIRSGTASGPFYCGNLTVLCHLIGTPFEPDLGGAILCIEDLNEAPYRIDRMLTQLRFSGSFDGLRGLALGSFSDCGPREQIQELVADRLGDMNIPILDGFSVGHAGTNITLPVGVPVCLDANAGSLAFSAPALLPH